MPHYFRIENRLKSHEKVCKHKNFRKIVIPSKNNNIVTFNQIWSHIKRHALSMLTLNLWLKKKDGCANNLEKPSTTKIGEHITRRHSMLTIWVFDNVESKNDLYRGEDCKKKFCTSLRKHATNVINFKKKEILPSTKRAKIVSICSNMLHLQKKNLKRVFWWKKY